MKYLGEQRSWDGDLRHLESDVAAMAHDLGTDLDELFRKVVSDQCSTASGKVSVRRKLPRFWAKACS
jgi:hypothetical protein